MLNKILSGIVFSLVVVILIILLGLIFYGFEDVATNEDAKNNIHKTEESIFQSINSIISWDSILGIILVLIIVYLIFFGSKATNGA